MSRNNKKSSLARSLNCHQRGNKTIKIGMKHSLHKIDTFMVLIQIVALNICLTSLVNKVALVNMSELGIYGTKTRSAGKVEVEAETRQADVALLSTSTSTSTSNTPNAFEFAVKPNVQTETITTTKQTILLDSDLTGSTVLSAIVITNAPKKLSELNDVTWTTTITQPANISISGSDTHDDHHEDEDDNIVISSSEIVSDSVRNNYMSNSSMKQRTINLVDLNNCYSKNKTNNLVESAYAEMDIKGLSSDQESSGYTNVNSSHYSNSRHILRILVVGLFGLVCLSLTIVYAIKFCVCKRRKKKRHDITTFGGSCPLRRNFVIDVDQIGEPNHYAHSACQCSCSNLAPNSSQTIEIPQSTTTPQLNRFQSLFKPDFRARNYRISDSNSAKTNPTLSQIGYLNNHQLLCDDETIANNRVESPLSCNLLPVQSRPLTSPNNSCRQYLPNFDRLYNYHYSHHNRQFNVVSSPSLMPLLTSCPCLPSTDQFTSTSQAITLQLDNLTNTSPTTTTALETSLEASRNEQIDSQQRPPTYYELFGGEQSQQETAGDSQVIGGATLPAQNEANDYASLAITNPSSSSVSQSSSTIDQQQQDRKNLLVKLNLNKTKLLSAGDLMLLSKLIDVPIVVQQQQQQHQEDQQAPQPQQE